MSDVKLGDLLHKSQSSLLTDNAKNMTKANLESLVKRDGTVTASDDDKASLRKLALTRINSGQTVFTFSHHSLGDGDTSTAQDPNTCVTI